MCFYDVVAGAQKERKSGSGKKGTAVAEAAVAFGPSMSLGQAAGQAKATTAMPQPPMQKAAKAGASKVTALHEGTEKGKGLAAMARSPVVAASIGEVDDADVKHQVGTAVCMCNCSILDTSLVLLSTTRIPSSASLTFHELYCLGETHGSVLCILTHSSIAALYYKDSNLQCWTDLTHATASFHPQTVVLLLSYWWNWCG